MICHAAPTQKQRDAVGIVMTSQPAAATAANHSQTKNRNFGQNPDFSPMRNVPNEAKYKGNTGRGRVQTFVMVHQSQYTKSDILETPTCLTSITVS